MRHFVAIAVVLTATLVAGQTLSPLNAECGKKCSGEFSITNNGVVPLVVTVEPYSFSFMNGKPTFQKIDGVAEVHLNALSTRVSPKQTYVFDYRVKCIQFPCSVGFAAGMTVGHTDEGMALRIVLNHVVYSCEKARNCRVSVLKAGNVSLEAKK